MKRKISMLCAIALGFVFTYQPFNASSGLEDVLPNSNLETSELLSEQINFSGRLIIEGKGDGWWEDQNTVVVICRY